MPLYRSALKTQEQIIAGLEALLAQAVKRSADPAALLHGIQQLKAVVQRRWAEDGLSAVAAEPKMRGNGGEHAHMHNTNLVLAILGVGDDVAGWYDDIPKWKLLPA